jgi:dihydroxy-acid dehydratase
MVFEDLVPERILTPAAVDNAIKVHMAMGGSTNAIIHVVAMARRAGIALDMQRFDQLSRQVPVLANVRPSGKYLMEDFFYAGGLRALMTELKDELDLSCVTVTGKTVGENIAGAQVYLHDVIHPLSDPIYAEGATAVLKGNLAPRGCVMKPAAADKRFLKHCGPALAFEDYNHMAREIERDDLDVTPDHVLVLKNAGPKGGPGMPEWGMLPIPKRLVTAGVRDMLRVSDGRMSGTSYGACILHVAPESYVGGPLALVETGDMVEVDVAARRIHLDVGEEALARRRAAWRPPAPRYERGYGVMFSTHIGQADDGCDFDFLGRGGPTPEPEIH